MRQLLAGGRVIDPAHGRDATGDVWIEDGRVTDAPDPGIAADERHDCAGLVVMAGGIDIHSHIAGSEREHRRGCCCREFQCS